MRVCVLGLLAAAGLTVLVAPAETATTATDPKFVPPNLDEVPKGTRVDVLADKLTYDGKANVATATGTVRLTYGPYVLTATRVIYDMKRGVFSANGSIVLREPNGNVLEAEVAEINDKFAKGFAEHVRALLTNNVTITARYARTSMFFMTRTIFRKKNCLIFLSPSSLITCRKRTGITSIT